MLELWYFLLVLGWGWGDGATAGLWPQPWTCHLPDGLDFWKSIRFTDYSQHNQMVMALTLRCPLKLEASLCWRQDPLTPCETLPNATAQESEGVRAATSLQDRGGEGWGPGTFSLTNSPLPNSGISWRTWTCTPSSALRYNTGQGAGSGGRDGTESC